MIKNIEVEIANLQFQLNLLHCSNREKIQNRLFFLKAKLEKLKVDSKQFLMDYYHNETHSL
tara:strand:- start:2356 stop:2538 length:183 start_codon:yes stop_codon:yes gene_type:complete